MVLYTPFSVVIFLLALVLSKNAFGTDSSSRKLCSRSLAGIACPNPTEGMDIRLLCCVFRDELTSRVRACVCDAETLKPGGLHPVCDATRQ